MRERSGLLRGYAVLAALVLYAPIVVMVIFSFNASPYIALPLRGFTLHWYSLMVHDGAMLAALGSSARVAAAAALIATVTALLAATGLSMRGVRGRAAFTGLIMLPLVLPGLILGVSILGLVLSLGLRPSLLTVCAGHVVLCMPFAFTVLLARIQGLDPALTEASRDLGEGVVATYLRITLPLMLPAILSSLLLCFLTSFDEFLIAFFLAGDTMTLPIFIYTQLRFPEKLPQVLALGSTIILSSIILVLVAERLQRIGRGSAIA
jgi:spermidine/putrescine transport system permease protein